MYIRPKESFTSKRVDFFINLIGTFTGLFGFSWLYHLIVYKFTWQGVSLMMLWFIITILSFIVTSRTSFIRYVNTRLSKVTRRAQ